MLVSGPHGDEVLTPDDGLAAVVERFAPLLHAQASYRLGRLREFYDPEDLVNDVWARVLPYLPGLCGREEFARPVVLKFLTVTLQHRVRDLVEKHIAGKPGRHGEALSRLPEQHSGVVTRAARGERAGKLRQALAGLVEEDRAVLVLRGIEQRSHPEVAAVLAIGEDACKKRFQRALERLRGSLPDDLARDFAG